QGSTLDSGVEQAQKAFDVPRLQPEQIIQISRSLSRFALDALSQQNALDRIQPAIPPRLQILAQVLLQQPAVHEGLVFFVGQVWPDYGMEEGRVLFCQEEVKLVPGELRIHRPLLLGLQLRPGEQECKLG